ncbi:MAG TPA: NADP-dependent oxidoreductase [Fontimonas sp.]
MTHARSWILQKRPLADIEDDTLVLTPQVLPALRDGEFLLRTILLSLDASNRIWMSDRDSYLPPVALGAAMRGVIVGEVMASRHPDFPPGCLASGFGTWSDWLISNGEGLTPMAAVPGLDLAKAFGVLAIAGPTAYIALHEIGRIQPGQTVTVTAAAGAVGMVVGQLAKIHGCRTIGVAGGRDKCRLLVEQYGYDEAIDYKSENVLERLRELAPDGIDVHVENVGGEQLDAALTQMKRGGTVVMSGLIASYGSSEKVPGPYEFSRVITQRLRIEGFICFDYTQRYPQYHAKLAQWIVEGRLRFDLHVVDGLDNAVKACRMLYSGGNQGKLLVRIGPDAL